MSKMISDLSQLFVCRNLADDEILRAFLRSEPQAADVARAVAALLERAEESGMSGDLGRAYVVTRLLGEPNLAARMVDLSKGERGASLRAAFIHDMEILAPLFFRPINEICPLVPSFVADYQPTMKFPISEATAELYCILGEARTPEALADGFLQYYADYGYGEIAFYRAFSWDSEHRRLKCVRNFENVRLSGLIGYQSQKDMLTKNTLAFLGGRPANNALLVGHRGTGKSTSIKALANEYFSLGLRLVQLTKNQLSDLPKIMELLRGFAGRYFIIYLDDLSFEAGDSEYKYVKSAIEGGVEPKPDNVLIYATSNRRHLIKESWADRENGDELYCRDNANETISLSDRFGLIINYRAPNQNEYLAIIDHALRESGVMLTPEELRIEGHRWELEHSGRNGRTAQQFVTYYLGQKMQTDGQKSPSEPQK